MPPSIPIVPSAGFNIAQAIAEAISGYSQARRETELFQRQKDIQDVELWQKLLPGLTQYTPPGEAPINNGALANVVLPTTEQIVTPAPTQRVGDALARLTGQRTIGLMPGQLNDIRENALGSATFGARAKAPAANLAATEAATQASQASTAKNKYELEVAPVREAAIYADSKAPAYVSAAIAQLGAPNGKNNNALIDNAYRAFQAADTSPYKQRITREDFGRAVQEYWNEERKFGAEWARIRVARDAAARENDPRIFLDRLADNYGQMARALDQDKAALLRSVPGGAALLDAGQVGAAEAQLEMFPDAKARYAALNQQAAGLRDAQMTVQKKMSDLSGIPYNVTSGGTQMPAAGGAPAGPTDGYTRAQSVWATAPNKQAGQKALDFLVRQGMITAEEANAIKKGGPK